MNTEHLKSSKFVKLLKDAGLVKQGVLQDHCLTSQLTKRRSVEPLTTVQVDLIFKKLTGNEKPPGNKLLLPSKLAQLEKKQFTQSLRVEQFVKALVLVGRTAFGFEHDSKDIDVLFRLINEYLVQLD